MWNTVKLKEIVNIDIGKTPARDNPKYWDKNKKSSNIWVSIRDMSANSGLYIGDSREYISNEGAKLFKEVPKNTLIMSFKLSIGKLAITKKNLRTNEAITAFGIKDETIICKEYLYYYLSSMNWDIIVGQDIKVKGKTLNKAKLKEILILLPPLTEQQRIVAKLDKIFAEIDVNKEATKSTYDYAVLLREKTFIYLFNQLTHEYGDTLLGDGIELISGQHIIAKDYNTQGIGIGYLTGPSDFGATFPIVTKFTTLPKKTSKKDDVLVTIKGSGIGKVNLMRDEELAISRQLAAIRPKLFTSEFVLLFMRTQYQNLQNQGNGAAIPGLSRDDILQLKIPTPPIKLQSVILNKAKKIEKLCEDYEKIISIKLTNLELLKSAILAKEIQPGKAA
jgi:type I restriction enzyme, S subunit